MSINDLEAILYIVRDMIQKVVEIDRDNTNLVKMASDIKTWVNTQRLNKYSVKNILVNSLPMHQLCVQLGLSYQEAERLYNLNPTALNPNFTSGSVSVYVN
jgi:hypothetical protein